MLKIGIIIGSTRPGRNGEAVAKWVYDLALRRQDASFELIDLAETNLPLLDEAMPPSLGIYSQPHTVSWSKKIAEFDGFIFVTPEYNHSISGALKNALDYLYKEWNNKVAGFVGYGNTGGARAVEHLRQITAELQMAGVREQVTLSIYTDFEKFSIFKPAASHEQKLNHLIDQVVCWGEALKLSHSK